MLAVVVVLLHWRFFVPCFSIARFTLTNIYPFCISNPAHCIVICNTFVFIFLGFPLYHKCYSFEWTFFTHKHFLLCNTSPRFGAFSTQIQAGTPHSGSFSMPALIELYLPVSQYKSTPLKKNSSELLS